MEKDGKRWKMMENDSPSTRRSRKQTVRTFLFMFLPIAAVVIIAAVGLIVLQSINVKTQLCSVEEQFAQGQKMIIAHHLDKVIEDVFYVASAERLLNIRGRELMENDVKRLAFLYRSFLNRRRVYDYIQWFNPKGEEVVRVNYREGETVIVPDSELRNRKERVYFRQALKIDRNEVYISDFDRDKAGEQNKETYYPSVRVSVPYFSSGGKIFGVVALSYRGQDIIAGLKKATSKNSAGVPLLCNDDGNWLYHPEPDKMRGFMLDHTAELSFAEQYPEAWKQITKGEEGVVNTKRGLFVYKTIKPLQEDELVPQALKDRDITVVSENGRRDGYYWKLISFIPVRIIVERVRLFVFTIISIAVAVLLTFGIAAFYMSKRRTERISAEEDYKQELRKLQAAVEQSANVIVITDTDGNIIFANKAFEESTGYTIEEALGKNPRILNSGRQADELYREMWQTISGGDVWKGEFLNRRKDGSLYWEEAVITPVTGETGEIEYHLAVKEDITRRKQTEEALTKAKEEAETANRLKSEFLANISHEIRTPMNAVLGFTDVLLEEEDDPKKSESLRVISNSGKALLALINDLLDFSKIESGKLTIEEDAFEVRNIVDGMKSMFTLTAEEKGIDFSVEIAEPLPRFLIGDEQRINQIVINLLSNAFKFTRAGTVTFALSYNKKQNEMLFRVSDTGIGIEAEKKKTIFSPFEQAESSTKRHYGGTGLGLAISKRLAELMNGSLDVTSTLETGSVFTLTLPLEEYGGGEEVPERSLEIPKEAKGKPDSEKSMVERWVARLNGDRDLEAILFEAIEDLPRKIAALEKAISENEGRKLKFLAHDLKGSSGNLGMNEVYKKAADINAEAEKEHYNLEKLRKRVNELHEIISSIPQEYSDRPKRKETGSEAASFGFSLTEGERRYLDRIVQRLQENISIFDPMKVTALADELDELGRGNAEPFFKNASGRLRKAADTFDDQAVRTILKDLEKII